MALDNKHRPWRVAPREHGGCPIPRWCSTRSGRSRPRRGPSSPPLSCWRECVASQSTKMEFKSLRRMRYGIKSFCLIFFLWHPIENLLRLAKGIYFMFYVICSSYVPDVNTSHMESSLILENQSKAFCLW